MALSLGLGGACSMGLEPLESPRGRDEGTGDDSVAASALRRFAAALALALRCPLCSKPVDGAHALPCGCVMCGECGRNALSEDGVEVGVGCGRGRAPTPRPCPCPRCSGDVRVTAADLAPCEMANRTAGVLAEMLAAAPLEQDAAWGRLSGGTQLNDLDLSGVKPRRPQEQEYEKEPAQESPQGSPRAQEQPPGEQHDGGSGGILAGGAAGGGEDAVPNSAAAKPATEAVPAAATQGTHPATPATQPPVTAGKDVVPDSDPPASAEKSPATPQPASVPMAITLEAMETPRTPGDMLVPSTQQIRALESECNGMRERLRELNNLPESLISRDSSGAGKSPLPTPSAGAHVDTSARLTPVAESPMASVPGGHVCRAEPKPAPTTAPTLEATAGVPVSHPASPVAQQPAAAGDDVAPDSDPREGQVTERHAKPSPPPHKRSCRGADGPSDGGVDGTAGNVGASAQRSSKRRRTAIATTAAAAAAGPPAPLSAAPPPEEGVVVSWSNLIGDEKDAVTLAAKKLGGVATRAWSSRATHLIMPIDEKGRAAGEPLRCTKRTLKYFQAVVAGKWVVGTNWLKDSEAAGKWLPPDPTCHVVMRDRNGPCNCLRARAAIAANQPPLLENHCVVVWPAPAAPPARPAGARRKQASAAPTVSQADLETLARAAGARVLNAREKALACNGAFEGAPLHVVLPAAPSDRGVVEVKHKHGNDCVPVSATWLLDTISRYEVMPEGPYQYFLSTLSPKGATGKGKGKGTAAAGGGARCGGKGGGGKAKGSQGSKGSGASKGGSASKGDRAPTRTASGRVSKRVTRH